MDKITFCPEGCAACAAIRDDLWLRDIPPRPSLETLLGPIFTPFLRDESLAREANEFGY